MAHLRLSQHQNAALGVELVHESRLHKSCTSLSSRLHHLSFLSSSSSSSSSCRGKRLNAVLVHFYEKDRRRSSWSCRCRSEPHLELPHDVEVLQASTMEEIYETLAKRLLLAANSTLSKYIVGMAGPPGAGKSTVAKTVVEQLNAMWIQTNLDVEWKGNGSQNDIAIALPMDGFHLYRSQLDRMDDPVEAHARRGAPWTFDPHGLINCLQSLRNQGWVEAPSFDHGVGDPKENDIVVTPSHKVVVVEGNYLLLGEEKWKALMHIFDERWFLDVDMETSLRRVVERFIMIGKSPDEARSRVEFNDRKNAETIFRSKVNADLIIKSVDSQKHL